MILLPFEKKINHTISILVCICLLLCFNSCSTGQETEPSKFKIGFSQCTGDIKWRNATVDAINRELIFHPGSELLYQNAADNSQLQIDQIRHLLQQDIDVLLVSPNEAEPLTAIVEEVYNKGIPVVVFDRRINSDRYTAFVGADNIEIGKMAGTYVTNLQYPNSKIIEIIGLKGSTSSLERKKGFEEALTTRNTTDSSIKLYGNWLQETAFNELWKIKDQLGEHDIVFAQNDPMALGAYEVYRKLGLEKKAQFIGVDGLAGQGGGIEMVSEKKLRATLLNPTGGEEALQIAFKILNKEAFNKENTLSTVVIDSANVRIMKLQTDKINTQQKDIKQQQDVLFRQRKMYDNQTTLVYIFIGALILVLGLAIISAYAFWNNRRINKKLSIQNQEISNQRNQLIEMTARAKEATDAKFNFFTKISHEFRTPLTLILGPLEENLATERLTFSIKNNLKLAHKNAMRLLRLINQLMDYRKIEEQRMKLNVTENDLVVFVAEIAEAFQVMAKTKSISFHIQNKIKVQPVWFDVNMLDKVLFNLLSNAFKFTKDNGGVISVVVDRDDNLGQAVIRVEDSGIGMQPHEAEHAFELFYQGNAGRSTGTGLGLSLSKELVELHHGSIGLKSEKWKGTSFEVRLPLGKQHFQATDFAESEPNTNLYEDVKIYSSELETIHYYPENKPLNTDKENSILIIEDNDDLRGFLKKHLGADYEIFEADNGKDGLAKAYETVPDLIISDIILPGKDGLYITEMIKQDIRTSHIPLVLLTAKSSIQEQIKGIRLQADAFIVKPFNLEYLTESIRNLLKSRASLREHYTSELPSEARTNTSKKIDRKFINEFTSIVESNMSNESFSIEDICKEIGISRVQLYRKVKALLGYNVNDYILTIRMNKARYLLVNEDLSIFEVACKVGFSSQAYFSTVFRSKFSMTPTEYRESKKS